MTIGADSYAGDRRTQNPDVVIRRLSSLASLAPEALALLGDLQDFNSHGPREDLVDERRDRPRFLISGWAARIRWPRNGRRQILNFVLPGDSLGLFLTPMPLAFAKTIALTGVRTVEAVEVVQAAVREPKWAPSLSHALMAAAALDETLMLNQVQRLGGMAARERICHLFLELHQRLSIVGLASEDGFWAPLTQEMLADASGLSIIHVSRVLKELRRDGIVQMRSSRVIFTDPEQLRRTADFHPPQPVSRAWPEMIHPLSDIFRASPPRESLRRPATLPSTN